MKIVDDILFIVDSGTAVALVGLDISAAFDTVSHRKLHARLEHDFSIEEVVLEWINSYLSKRIFSFVLKKAHQPSLRCVLD